jgi:hypothetical protein
MGRLTVGDVACGRAGDKGATLDLTVVAADDRAYRALAAQLTAEAVAERFGAKSADRYEVPSISALKFVLPDFLGAGPWASRRAGVHWQKTAISAVLAMEITEFEV